MEAIPAFAITSRDSNTTNLSCLVKRLWTLSKIE